MTSPSLPRIDFISDDGIQIETQVGADAVNLAFRLPGNFSITLFAVDLDADMALALSKLLARNAKAATKALEAVQ